VDFTDAANPFEIAYFDRGPVDPKMLILAGSWSAYWYNGRIYSSEIARGLDIFELTPTANLTQNEIDAAKSVHVDVLNVQNQQRIEWPKKLVVAKAYLDQLERSKGLSTERIAALRQAIQKAESSPGELGKLKSHAKDLKKDAAQSTNAADSSRLNGLADIFSKPVA